MAVNTETPIQDYVGGGKHFDFHFRIIEKKDLEVYINGVKANGGYTVTIDADKGGAVDFTADTPAGAVVQLRRATEFTRITNYIDNGDLLADTLDEDFDRIWLALQEQKAKTDITLTRPVGPNTAWAAGGSRIENVADGVADADAATVGQVKTFNGGAQNSMNAAAASAQASAGSAAAAAQSAAEAAQSAQTGRQAAADAAQSSTTAWNHVQTTAQNVKDAQAAAGQAAASAGAAATSAATATSAQQSAQSYAQTAQTAAQQAMNVAPGNYVLKTNNLSDLSDKAASLRTLLDGKPLPLAAEGVAAGDAVSKNQLETTTGTHASAYEVWSQFPTAPANGTPFQGGMVQSSFKNIAADSRTVAAAGMQVVDTYGNFKPVAYFGVANYDFASLSLKWVHMDLDWTTKQLTLPGGLHSRDVMYIQRNDNPQSAAMLIFQNGKGVNESSIYGERDGDVTIATNGANQKYFTFSKTGNFVAQGDISASKSVWGGPGFDNGVGGRGEANNPIKISAPTGGTLGTGTYFNKLTGNYGGAAYEFGGVTGGAAGQMSHVQLNIMSNLNNVNGTMLFKPDGSINTNLGNVQIVASDIKFKDDIEDVAAGALDRIDAVELKEFTWKHNGRRDRGFIAQQLAGIDELYTYKDDFDNLNYSSNAIIADLIGAVQTLAARVKELEAKSK